MNRKFIRLYKRMIGVVTDWDELKWFLEDKLIYSWLTPLRSFKEQVERMFYWAIRMRKSYDFDAQTLYATIYYKLDAVYDTMKNHSHLQWNSSEDTKLMKRLNEARLLAKRLSEWKEHDRAVVVMDKYKPNNERRSILNMNRGNAKSINPKLYSFMFRAAVEKDQVEYKDTKRRLYHLLETYLDYWWD